MNHNLILCSKSIEFLKRIPSEWRDSRLQGILEVGLEGRWSTQDIKNWVVLISLQKEKKTSSTELFFYLNG